MSRNPINALNSSAALQGAQYLWWRGAVASHRRALMLARFTFGGRIGF
jgi:hypothetical protein